MMTRIFPRFCLIISLITVTISIVALIILLVLLSNNSKRKTTTKSSMMKLIPTNILVCYFSYKCNTSMET